MRAGICKQNCCCCCCLLLRGVAAGLESEAAARAGRCREGCNKSCTLFARASAADDRSWEREGYGCECRRALEWRAVNTTCMSSKVALRSSAVKNSQCKQKQAFSTPPSLHNPCLCPRPSGCAAPRPGVQGQRRQSAGGGGGRGPRGGRRGVGMMTAAEGQGGKGKGGLRSMRRLSKRNTKLQQNTKAEPITQPVFEG